MLSSLESKPAHTGEKQALRIIATALIAVAMFLMLETLASIWPCMGVGIEPFCAKSCPFCE